MKGRIHRPNKEKRPIIPRIGFIKTGYKTGQGYPKSTDYFICSSIYETYFNDVYDKPSTIQIVFFDNDPEISCKEEYILMDKDGKKFAYGNGTEFEAWDGQKYMGLSIKKYPNLMQDLEKRSGSKKGWEIILTMRFVLPKIPKILGYFEYNTRAAASTIPNIRETFDAILEQRQSVLGMVFDLNVSFAKSQKPGKANKYPVVNLVANHSDNNLQMFNDSIANLAYDDTKRKTPEISEGNKEA